MLKKVATDLHSERHPHKPHASFQVGRVVVVVVVIGGVSGAVRRRHTRSDCRRSQADKLIETLLFLIR